MTGRLRIGIAAAVALLATASGLLRLLAAGRWIWPVIGAVVVAAAAGELARRLIRPRPLVVLVQIVFVFWYDVVLLAHKVAFGGVLPTWTVFHRIADLYSAGGHDIRTTYVGGPTTTGITAILVLSMGALAILVDALAATYAAAPLAGLPLLALYLVPATRSGGGYDWLAFGMAALGYTALLSAEGRDRLGRWGRPLVHTSRRTGPNGQESERRQTRVDTGPIAATGHQITMFALVAAVLAPVLLPTINGGLFGIGPDGGGNGAGHKHGGTISTKLDLKSSLGSASDDVVLTYTTTDPDKLGQYLRLEVDDAYNPLAKPAWTQDPKLVTRGIDASGAMAPGVPKYTVSQTQPKKITMTVKYPSAAWSIGEPGKYELPVPYAAAKLGSPSEGWIYSAQGLDVNGPQKIFDGMTYTVDFFDVDNPKAFTQQQMHDVQPLSADQQAAFAENLDYKNTPQEVVDEALRQTGKYSNPVDKANALQRFFQDTSRFKYNLNVPTPANGAAGEKYLLEHNEGFCQFYAETMAAMARVAGIPSRVVVGFTPGQQDAKTDVFTVKVHDTHAWPELYFQGLGWVRFEPTVGIDSVGAADGHGRIPKYVTDLPGAPTTNPSQTSTTSAGPSGASASKSNCPVNLRRQGNCLDDTQGATAGQKQPFGYLGWFGAVPRFLKYWLFGGSGYAIAVRFILLALLLIACVPMVVRIVRRRRRGRLASGRRAPRGGGDDDGLEWESADLPGAGLAPDRDPERLRILAAWAEVRDSATDLGYAWPLSETPRQSAERIIRQAHFSSSAQDAMDRVTGLAERANYARTVRPGSRSGAAPGLGNLMTDVRTIRTGLAEPVSRRTRLRAAVMPPSALAALRERREDLTTRAYERVQVAGARMRPRLPRRPGR